MLKPARHPTQKRYIARIVVEFDDEVFARIYARAVRERTSFAEQVRLLCEWGLEQGGRHDG